jgi:RNA recognition motif-containing protein
MLQIVVERLSKNVNEDHLHEIFGQFGPIADLDLPMNKTCTSRLGVPAGDGILDTTLTEINSWHQSRHCLHSL